LVLEEAVWSYILCCHQMTLVHCFLLRGVAFKEHGVQVLYWWWLYCCY
jgi:hypothetical protein